uniref:CSON014788 protein n=1 Tax=Culicoides sonorensis TaxID=179676 RepID=A0A336LNE9_CULSO
MNLNPKYNNNQFRVFCIITYFLSLINRTSTAKSCEEGFLSNTIYNELILSVKIPASISISSKNPQVTITVEFYKEFPPYSHFVYFETKSDSLKLIEEENYSNGVTFNENLQFKIIQRFNYIYNYRLKKIKINNIKVCETLQNGPFSIEEHKFEFPLILQKLNNKKTKVTERVSTKRNQKTTRKTSSKSPPKYQIYPSDIFHGNCGAVRYLTAFVRKGIRAEAENWPWAVAITVNEDFKCSGTFITRSRIVTAAHCVEDLKIKSLKKHPKYKKIPRNDIAYIDLREPIVDEMFAPACVGSGNTSSFMGDKGIVATYAPATTLEIQDADIGELRKGSLKIVDPDNCKENQDAKIPKSSFCVGEGKKQYLCQGDSGGGFYKKIDNKLYLLGVVSTGLIDDEKQECDQSDYVIFTDVLQFEDFLGTDI